MVDQLLSPEVVLEGVHFELVAAQVPLHLHLDETGWQLLHVFVRREVALRSIVQARVPLPTVERSFAALVEYVLNREFLLLRDRKLFLRRRISGSGDK